MAHSLTHLCPNCTSATDIPYSAFAFSQNHLCPTCGTTSTGLSAQPSTLKMQDELAALLSRNLTLTQPSYAPSPEQAPQQDLPTQPSQPITYSVSQHYHHSAHLAKSAPTSTTNSFSSPVNRAAAEHILRENSIDPSALFPSQLTLFLHAAADQQLRLLELWRISPPSYGGHALANELGNWPATSFEQEEVMAELRYERHMFEEKKKRDLYEQPDTNGHGMTMEGMEQDSRGAILPIEGGDGRNVAEPYIISGYESSGGLDHTESSRQQQVPRSYNQATDPVYQGLEHWKNLAGQQSMEHQYGAFEQMRQYGGLSCSFAGHGHEDEEML